MSEYFVRPQTLVQSVQLRRRNWSWFIINFSLTYAKAKVAMQSTVGLAQEAFTYNNIGRRTYAVRRISRQQNLASDWPARLKALRPVLWVFFRSRSVTSVTLHTCICSCLCPSLSVYVVCKHILLFVRTSEEDETSRSQNYSNIGLTH